MPSSFVPDPIQDPYAGMPSSFVPLPDEDDFQYPSSWEPIEEAPAQQDINPAGDSLFAAASNFLFGHLAEFMGTGAGVMQAGMAATFDSKARDILFNGSTEQFRKTFPLLKNFVDKPAGETVKTIAGQAASAAGQVAPFSSGVGLAALDKLPAVTAAMRGGKGVAARVGLRGAQSAVAPALGAAGQSLQNQESLGKVAGKAAGAGAFGAALGGGIQLGFETINAVAQALPERLYNSALGVKKTDIKAGYSPSAELIKKGEWGSLRGIKDRQQAIADAADDAVDKILKGSEVTTKPESFFQAVADNYNKSYKGKLKPEDVKLIVGSLDPRIASLAEAKTWTLEDANKFRQTVDKVLGHKTFIAAQLPFKKEVADELTNNIRGAVQSLAPDTKPLFKDWATAIRTTRAIEEKLAAQGSNIVGAGDIWTAVAGGAASGGITGAVALPIARRLAGSGLTKTAAAVGLDRIGNAIDFMNLLPGNLRVQIVKLLTDAVTGE